MSRFLKFLKQDPENINLLIAISSEYHALGEFSEALSFLEQAINLAERKEESPSLFREFYALKAEIYFDNHQPELAQQAAKRCLALAPTHCQAEIILVLVGLETGETTMKEINKLLKKYPLEARLWFAKGVLFFQKLQFHEAEEAHRKASELETSFYENWLSLAWCQLFLDKLASAKANYHQAAILNKEGAEAWGGLALIHALNTELTEANTLIVKAKILDPGCFLASIAELICTHQQDKEKIFDQFKQCLPMVATQITAAMERLI